MTFALGAIGVAEANGVVVGASVPDEEARFEVEVADEDEVKVDGKEATVEVGAVDEEARVDVELEPCCPPPWPIPLQTNATDLNSTRAKHTPTNSLGSVSMEFNAGPKP